MRLLFCIILVIQSFSGYSIPQGDWDNVLQSKGLVNVQTLDSSIQVQLQYAQPDNFMGKAVYDGLTYAWLRPEAAKCLVEAQKLLKREYPEWTLVIYDAARPMSVQRKMWNLVRGTNKTNYVSNPANGGGLHNYGMAVDVTILDETGLPLPMGSPFDFFGEEAHTTNEEALLEQGKITRDEYNNRRLLRRVMKQAGFRTIPYEWWHFNACTRAEARQRYPVIE
ncbi:M15 family metallopeptidase [Parabacteroides bouchesdurhonensis]|uniref:M15 family metallopeptidase n=1 Tax=Parabacteroides bouchesdurhonensis TaxID=1936995 RepID=UPI000E5119A9|nr:M15 family metallopeptidase [Parabacteroides bouchesdurhonensis]RHJ93408.1 peptidase M15 [Bacteroides sp. AM07-16]